MKVWIRGLCFSVENRKTSGEVGIIFSTHLASSKENPVVIKATNPWMFYQPEDAEQYGWYCSASNQFLPSKARSLLRPMHLTVFSSGQEFRCSYTLITKILLKTCVRICLKWPVVSESTKRSCRHGVDGVWRTGSLWEEAAPSKVGNEHCQFINRILGLITVGSVPARGVERQIRAIGRV